MAANSNQTKNVLVIVYYFPPMGGSGVQRPLKFVKYLRKYGWNPIVLCPEPGAYHTFDDSLYEELKRMNVDVIRVKGGTPLHKTGSKRKVELPAFLDNTLRKISTFFWLPDNKKGWIKEAEVKALEIIQEKEIKVIFSTAAPYSNLILAGNLKDKTNLPVVMDLRDEWLDSHLIKYPTTWHKNKMRAIEAQTLQKADIITVINSAYKQSFGLRYPDKEIRVVNQGFDPEDFENNSQSKTSGNKIRFLYSGIFYGDSSNPLLFLKSIADIIKNRPELKRKLELHFQGGLDKTTIDYIDKIGLSDLVINHGYLTHKEAVKNISEADILWLIIGHRQHAELITVGKMFEYFGSHKQILALAPKGATTDLLEKYGAYYQAEPYSLDEIKQTILKIIEDFEKDDFAKPNEKFIKLYNRISITEVLADIFNQLSNK